MATFIYNRRLALTSIARQIYAGNSNVEVVDDIIRINNEGTDFYAPLGQSLNWYNGEILTKFRYTGGDGLIGVVGFRFTGNSQATANGYSISLYRNGTVPGFVLYDNQRGTVRGSEFPFSHQQNTWYWVRVNWSGPNIKYKVWNDGYTEPSGWSREVVSNTISGAITQTAGLYTWNSGTVEYGWLSYENYGETVMGPAKPHAISRENYAYSANTHAGYYNAGYVWPLKASNSYDLEARNITAKANITKPIVTAKYVLPANQVWAGVNIWSPSVVYKEPGKTYIVPPTVVARAKISKPSIAYTAPPPSLIVTGTISAAAIVTAPSLSFKDIERYELSPTDILTLARITSPMLRFRRAQVVPDIWKTPQSEIEHEWRKLPYTSEATGAWRNHQYYRSDDQVWRNNLKEDASQWRKPVSTTRDEQEWRRVVYD
jgi:hypothetical protein